MRTITHAVLLSVLLLPSAHTVAKEKCRPVSGYFTESALSGPACASPVGVCTEGVYRGVLRGAFITVASSLTSTADTPTTSVSLFTADSTIHARLYGKAGDLFVKNAGAFRTSGAGEVVDLQTIVGGTGALSGATGVLRVTGTFTFASGGRSEYKGRVCLP